MRWLGGIFAVLALAGCGGHTIIDYAYGELRLVAWEQGVQLVYGLEEGDEPTLHLENAVIGCSLRRRLMLRNTGTGLLDVQSIFVEGPQAAFFTVPLTLFRLTPGESTDFDVSVAVPVEAVGLTSAEARVRVTWNALAGAKPDDVRTSSFVLHALPVGVDVELPELDFGGVARGDSAVRTLTFSNPAGWPVTAAWEKPGAPFSLSPDSPPGERELAAGKHLEVKVVFAPPTAGQAFGTLYAAPLGACGDRQPVKLRGDGMDQLLTWTPSQLDFGSVSVGTTATADLTFANHGFAPVWLTSLAAYEATTFSTTCTVTDVTGAVVGQLDLPAATRDATSGALIPGTAVLRIACHPTRAGPRQGVVRGTTTLSRQQDLAIPLRLNATP